MKKYALLVGFLSVAGLAHAADITAGVNSPNGVVYNTRVRDVLDGSGAPTVDTVSASTYSVVNTTTIVKASAGYVEQIIVTNLQVPNLCSNPFPIKVLNTATAPTATTQPVVMISSTAAIAALAIPVKSRVDTGITVGIDGTCVPVPTVSIHYR